MPLSIEEREKVYKLWGNDVRAFAEDFFPHLLKKRSSGFHDVIYRELPKHQYMLVEVFRGGAKSTLGLIIYAIHFAIFKRYGDISLLSKSETFITNEAMRVIKKEFESNAMIRQFFGDMTTGKWAETYFVLSNGVAFEGQGIGGQLRGGRRGLIVLDDLEDEESVLSDEQREKLRKRVLKELIPKLLGNGQMIYFGTPVHTLCFLRQIADTPDNGWFKLRFPAYKVLEDGSCPEIEGNEAWADEFPHSRLQDIKQKLGSNYFSSEYMCKPVSDETAPVKDKDLRYWKELPSQLSCVIAVDPAYSEDVKSDYKVASLVGIDPQMNRYLVNYIRTHSSIGDFIDSVINMYLANRDKVQTVGVPDSGTEKSFFQSFLKQCESRKVNVPIVPLKNVSVSSGQSIRNKIKRITATLQPLFEAHRYWIGEEMFEAREELLTIGSSIHDDIVDTMTYAEQILVPNYVDVKSEVGRYGEMLEVEKIKKGDFGYGL
jgi:phage terminase large subunit-like protein